MSSVLEAVRELTYVVDAALPCAAQISRLSDSETTELMSTLGTLARKVAGASSLVATDIDRRSARELGAGGLAQSKGLRNGPELVQRLTGSSIAEAKRLVRVGDLLEAAEAVAPAIETEPRSVEALRGLGGAWDAPIAVAIRNEWLTGAEGVALRSGLGAPRSAVLADAWRNAVIELIADAWAAEWTAEDLGRAAGRVRAALDAAAAQSDARARFEARSLKRWQLRNGNWRWSLEVDPETDAALWGPLSTRLSPRLGGPRFRTEEEIARAAELEQDPRSNEQLLLDEFTGIYGAGVAAGSAGGAFGKAEPHVSIVVTSGELRKATERGAGGDQGLAWVSGQQPVTAVDALRAICTGTFTPILFDEAGKAIDVGKDQRVFTARQRRAMAVRDGGCRWPGCTRPPGECEAHHDNPWGEGPQNHKTETRDGILLCKFHHLTVHNHGARISRQGSVYWLRWPGRAPVPLSSKSGVMTQLRITGARHDRAKGTARADV